MSRGAQDELLLFADDRFTLEQCDSSLVPGYLVLRLKSGATSLGALSPADARSLGEMLARAARAIEAATGAERVYCLSFCEVERRLHFHLFPRTRSLLAAYREATGAPQEPPDGPGLFDWARRALVAGRPLPAGIPAVHEVLSALRSALAR